MKLTKIVAFLLAMLMLVGVMASCDNTPAENNTNDDQSQSQSQSQTQKKDEYLPLNKEKLIFMADGKYGACIIKAEGDDSAVSGACTNLRNAFYALAGKRPSMSSDTAKDIDNVPAIIVGNTKIAESSTLYNSLKENEAAAKFIDGKYVISYKSEVGLIKIIEKVVEKINACTDKKNIVIDSSWDIKLTESDVVGPVTELPEYIELPQYNGREFNVKNLDDGQGSTVNIATYTDKSEYEYYNLELLVAGFELYTENTIGENLYATYITKQQIVTVMFFPAKSETRVTVDQRSKFDLPELEEDNVYIDGVSEPSLTVVAVGSCRWVGGMGYAYKLSDGTFFIIDGGISVRESSANANGITKDNSSGIWLYKTLRELADDPDNIVISAWLITHIHTDHIGAFIDMADFGYMDGITVEKFIYNQPSDEQMRNGGSTGSRIDWADSALAKWQANQDTEIKVYKAHPGQEYFIKDATIRILTTQDMLCENKISNANDASVVFQVDFQGKRALYLGDAEGMSNPVTAKVYKDELKSDIVQTPHHGYNGTKADVVYPYVKPTMAFFPICSADYNISGHANVYNGSINALLRADGITPIHSGDLNLTLDKNYQPTERGRWKPAGWTTKPLFPVDNVPLY